MCKLTHYLCNCGHYTTGSESVLMECLFRCSGVSERYKDNDRRWRARNCRHCRRAVRESNCERLRDAVISAARGLREEYGLPDPNACTRSRSTHMNTGEPVYSNIGSSRSSRLDSGYATSTRSGRSGRYAAPSHSSYAEQYMEPGEPRDWRDQLYGAGGYLDNCGRAGRRYDEYGYYR